MTYLQSMPDHKAILRVAGYPVFQVTKIEGYQDPRFAALKLHAPVRPPQVKVVKSNDIGRSIEETQNGRTIYISDLKSLKSRLRVAETPKAGQADRRGQNDHVDGLPHPSASAMIDEVPSKDEPAAPTFLPSTDVRKAPVVSRPRFEAEPASVAEIPNFATEVPKQGHTLCAHVCEAGAKHVSTPNKRRRSEHLRHHNLGNRSSQQNRLRGSQRSRLVPVIQNPSSWLVCRASMPP